MAPPCFLNLCLVMLGSWMGDILTKGVEWEGCIMGVEGDVLKRDGNGKGGL